MHTYDSEGNDFDVLVNCYNCDGLFCFDHVTTLENFQVCLWCYNTINYQ